MDGAHGWVSPNLAIDGWLQIWIDGWHQIWRWMGAHRWVAPNLIAPNLIDGWHQIRRIRQESRPTVPANNITHFAVRADNVSPGRKFYEIVFGWQFQEWGPPDFYLIKTGTEQNPGIMGALQQRTEPVGMGFNGYECTIGVENLSETETKIVRAGGTILMKPMEIPSVGRLIRFAGSLGAADVCNGGTLWEDEGTHAMSQRKRR